MILENVATIRTGVVTTRKKAEDSALITYKLLNLKCAVPSGYIDLNYAEEFPAAEPLKLEYFT